MICERLKILLKELDISQRQFALKIGLDAGYFSRIINGKANPPERILLLISNIFNVNKRWLENGEGEIFSTQAVSLAKKQVLEAINTLNDEQVKAVLAFINSLDEVKKSFGTVDEDKTVVDEEPEEDTETLEESYIEKLSKTASNTKMSIVLNSLGEIKRTNDL